MSEDAKATAQDTTTATAETSDAGKDAKTLVTGSETPPESTPEVKADASKESPKTDAPKEEKTVVPEKYDLKLPQGSDLTTDYVEKVASFAKERGLSNEQAQAVLDREIEARASVVEGQKQAIEQSNQKWFQALQSDSEIGGANLEQNGELAHRAAAHWFGEEFVNVIKQSKLNHYPALFKGLVRLGREMSDDQLVNPHAQQGGKKLSRAEILYGSKD